MLLLIQGYSVIARIPVFQLEEDDLIKKCKNAILEKMIPLDKVDLVYDSLYSNIRNDNYITIKNGEIVSISFENFHKKYRKG